MGIIKTLIDKKTNKFLYPVTKTTAVYDDNKKRLSDLLGNKDISGFSDGTITGILSLLCLTKQYQYTDLHTTNVEEGRYFISTTSATNAPNETMLGTIDIFKNDNKIRLEYRPLSETGVYECVYDGTTWGEWYSYSSKISGLESTLESLSGVTEQIDTINKSIESIQKNITDYGDVSGHINNEENPHKVTKSQVGLGNVPNVSTNNQTPTYSTATELTELESGEALSIAFGKLAKSISVLSNHLINYSKDGSLGHVILSNDNNIESIDKYALPSIEKNPNIDGTLAFLYNSLNTNLTTNTIYSDENIIIKKNGNFIRVIIWKTPVKLPINEATAVLEESLPIKTNVSKYIMKSNHPGYLSVRATGVYITMFDYEVSAGDWTYIDETILL